MVFPTERWQFGEKFAINFEQVAVSGTVIPQSWMESKTNTNEWRIIMDSISQIALGGAVGEVILGRQIGNRAILWGAAFGTLPDLDFLLTPFVDAIGVIVNHRGLSHSLLGIAMASPVLSWIYARWYRECPQSTSYARWLQFFVWVFLTHILLDCCTTYGTQVFYPFSDVRVAFKSIFIVDPLYTVPFSMCVVTCMFLTRQSHRRRVINYIGLGLSTCYLALTLVNKLHVNQVFGDALARQQIVSRRFMTSPTLMNNVLWYGIAEVDDGFQVGFYSLMDSTDNVQFEFVPRREDLLGELAETYGVERLIWFADGYYCVRPHKDGVLLHAMKFGKINIEGEPELYAFSYLIRDDPNPEIEFRRYEPWNDQNRKQRFRRLWTRLTGDQDPRN